MSRHTMLQQYDRVMRDQMIKRRNLQQRYEKIFKADDEPDDIDDDHVDDDIDEERLDGDNGSDSDNGDNGNNEPRHLVDQLADLMVEAGSSDGEVTREDA